MKIQNCLMKLMDFEIEQLRRHHYRHKIVTFSIIGFLFVLSFAVITISRQLTDVNKLTFRSMAEEAPSAGSLNQNGDYSGNLDSDITFNNQKTETTQSCCQAEYYRDGTQIPPCAPPSQGGCGRSNCWIKCTSSNSYNNWPGIWSEESCAAKARDVCGCYSNQEFCAPIPMDTPIVLPEPEATVAPTASPTATIVPSPTTPSNCRGVAYPSQNNQGLALGCFGSRFNQAQIRCYNERVYQNFCNARSMSNNICYSSNQWQQIATQVCCSGECQNAQSQNRTVIITAPTNP